MKNRIYILLDQSLSNQQKVVQAAHLSLEVIRLKGSLDYHPSIIILAVNANSFSQLREYLAKKRIDSVDFYEPLLEAVTGIATVPLTPADGKFLQHLPMLKSRDFLGEC
jgi:hypothetical protein